MLVELNFKNVEKTFESFITCTHVLINDIYTFNPFRPLVHNNTKTTYMCIINNYTPVRALNLC